MTQEKPVQGEDIRDIRQVELIMLCKMFSKFFVNMICNCKCTKYVEINK